MNIRMNRLIELVRESKIIHEGIVCSPKIVHTRMDHGKNDQIHQK